MAPTTANEVLMLFSSALSQPADSEQQASILEEVRASMESDPGFIPVLYSTILSVAPRAGAVLKRWIADVVELVVARLGLASNALSPEQRVHMTIQSIDAILLFLESEDREIHKLGIQCFATAFPMVFRHACGSGSDPRLWEKATRAKAIVLNAWRNGSTGLKVAAMKSVQKIIQSQTRVSADPRLQNRGDVNLSMCPSHHPFIKAQQLEEEANKLVEEAFSLLYLSKVPDIICSVINTFTILVKARPALAHLIFGALTNWTPANLPALSAVQIKSVEKTIRLALVHLLRSGHGNAYAAQINDFLHRQDQRMKTAWEVDQRRKEQEASLKRQRISEELENSNSHAAGLPYTDGPMKRRRLEDGGRASTPLRNSEQEYTGNIAIFAGASGTYPPHDVVMFDVTTIPAEVALEALVSSLQMVQESVFNAAVETCRRRLAPPTYQKVTEAATSTPAVKSEAVALDPLNLELDEDDLDRRARDAQAHESRDKAAIDAAEAEVVREGGEDTTGGETTAATSEPYASSPLALAKLKSKLLHAAVDRICAVGKSSATAVQAGGGDKDLWIQLISRLVTRGLPDAEDAGDENTQKEKDSIRKQIYDFVTANLSERIELARLWLNEEWYTESLRKSPSEEEGIANQIGKGNTPYATWLTQLLDHISSSSSIDKEKGTAFTQFFVDLPEIPKAEMRRLAKMCEEPSGMKIGFITLRDLATLRPPLRQDAMDVLLALTTHAERTIRASAILTIKRWVPDTEPLSQMGLDFAIHLLKRLEVSEDQQGSATTAEGNKTEGETESSKPEDGDDSMDLENDQDELEVAAVAQLPSKVAIVEAGKVVSGLPDVKTEGEVAQHIELLLGLVSKSPDLLDELFKTYTAVAPEIKTHIQNLFTPLVRSLGPSNTKIASIVQDYPTGSEDLVLRMLSTLSQNGKLPPSLSTLMKSIASEKDVNPRFMVPVIADLDKAEILKHLPRIISLLSGRQAEKEMVRQVFQSIVTTPPQSFGSVTSNVPRVRQSELLTPVELLVLLHQGEKEIGIKQSIEAIGICFSMTDAFRPEVLGAFMQQIVDEATLPTLFLRTVIQAVTTYKSLQPYVSNTLLSRLITKKIWTMPQLWQGFIRCAKVIVPHSYGAILQLPREQIKEVVTKQPDMKEGLKEYVLKKAGTNRTRIAGILEVLDGEA